MSQQVTTPLSRLNKIREKYPQRSDSLDFLEEIEAIIMQVFEEHKEIKGWERISQNTGYSTYQKTISKQYVLEMEWIKAENTISLRIFPTEDERFFPGEIHVWILVPISMVKRQDVEFPPYARASEGRRTHEEVFMVHRLLKRFEMQ